MLKVSFAAGSTTASIIAHTVPARAPNKVWFKVPTMSSSLSEVVQHRPGFTQLFDGLLLDWSAFLFFCLHAWSVSEMVVLYRTAICTPWRWRAGGFAPHLTRVGCLINRSDYDVAHGGWLPYLSLRL